MKGFFSWFKSGNKIKRWLFLIILSMISVCYSISIVLVTNELDVKNIFKIVLWFVIGFVGMIIGCISIQKRNLEILVKKTDKGHSLKSLIYNKKVFDQGPKIVVIGGGRGLNTVLKGLKEYTQNITAVVQVSESSRDGDSDVSSDSSALQYKEIKDSIIALAGNEEELNRLFNLRFQYGGGKQLYFGDIYMLAMKNLYSDFSSSIEKSECILNMTGRVLPVTQDKFEVCAELSDGTVEKGKNKIPSTVSSRLVSIRREYITPSNAKVTPGVVEAIKEADAIIIGPGSLYTDVIPNLLVSGVSKAIRQSDAFKIYISNIMTEQGQTTNYSLSDHIKAIKRHIGGDIDYCIYDSGDIMPEYIRKYNMKGSELVEQDIQNAKAEGVKVIKRDLAVIEDNHIKHDSNAVANAIIELICEDLKFRDRQNDPQYMMLSHKLKNKRIGPNQKERWQKPKLDKSGKSKFYTKYSTRINSLKESNKKIKSDINHYEKNRKIYDRISEMQRAKSDLEKLKRNK